ncbi:MAG: hypothetical protein ACWA5L_11480 [bacterium]
MVKAAIGIAAFCGFCASAWAAPPATDYAKLCHRPSFVPGTIDDAGATAKKQSVQNVVRVLSDILNDDTADRDAIAEARTQLERYAQQKNKIGAEAHLALAKYHRKTNRTANARATVIGHYEAALNLGLSVQSKLGDVYSSSFGGRPDYERARNYYGIAFANGDIRAWIGLSEIQRREGQDVEALALLDRAQSMALQKASEGKCNSLRYIADAFASLEKTPENEEEARQWYKAAAEGGDVTAARYLYNFCRSNDNTDLSYCRKNKALDWLQIAAESGSTVSMRNLGYAYLNNEKKEDRPKGFYWLEQAVYHGDRLSLEKLQEEYLKPGQSNATQAKGRIFLEYALKDKNVPTETFQHAGDVYFYGLGGDKDIEKALRFYRKALKREEDKAAFALGKYYNYQPPNRKNLNKAARYYREAAYYGSNSAMVRLANLSRCYAGTEYESIFPSADKWEERALEAKTRVFKFEKAREAIELGDVEQYRNVIRELAFSGKAEAMFALINSYKSDPDKAALAQLWTEKLSEPRQQNAGFYLSMAENYLSGEMLPFDPDRANEMYEAAFKADPAKAYTAFAKYKLTAPERFRDMDLAVTMLTRAMNDGDSDAAMELLEYYENNSQISAPDNFYTDFERVTQGRPQLHILFRKTKQTYSKEELLQVAQEIENLQICNSRDAAKLAKLYAEKIGDHAKALQWAERAEKFYERLPATIYDLALVFEDIGRDAKASAYLQQAVLFGYPQAIDRQAIARYAAGQRDPETLSMILTSSSRLRLKAKSLKALIELLDTGELNATQQEEASQILTTVIENATNPEFFAKLAKTYMSMSNVDQQSRGQYYLQRAAELGDANAMLLLSRHYAIGFLVEQSATQSTQWLKRAAEIGNSEAMLKYSIALRQGYGVTANNQQADYWQNRAVGERP